MLERDLTTGDSDTAACRLFIDTRTVITAYNAALAAFLSAPMAFFCLGRDALRRKTNRADSRGARGEVNDASGKQG